MMLLLKIPAALIGLVLTLGGLGGFFWSILLAIAYLTYEPSGPRLAGTPQQTPPGIAAAVAWFIGSVVILGVGTQLGRFARGDFD